jgi:anti-sigma B factor antagonist
VLAVDASYEPGRIVLRVTGELDLATAPAFRHATLGAMAELSQSDVVGEILVDLSGCDLLDSVGVGLLLGLHKRARAGGATMSIRCEEDRIRRVLALTEVDRIIPVWSGLEGPTGSVLGAE